MDMNAERAAARAEGRLKVVGLTDAASVGNVIWPAFQHAVGDWAELEYIQDVSAPRVEAALAAERADRPDVAIVASPARLDRRSLLDRADLVADAAYPTGWIDARRRWWPIYVQPIVAIYNEHYVGPPASWADLASASLRGRVVYEQPQRMLTTGPALAELSASYGDAWRPYLDTLVAAEPLLVGDNERAV
ncbi:MAG TPA: ABC transporter substrate-binding protein, partial [Candidatus Limnocylindrales bacterium]|nr:ABC transporter substrate-binding protein [Candidatus Limnocylindrales bacterium]